MFNLFFSPRGRIGRLPFFGAALAWLVFYGLQQLWFKKTGTNQLNFFLALGFLFLNLHIVFCLYGKRLHDIGRSLWPLIGVFCMVIFVAIMVMLKFGGLTYFDSLMQNPEMAEDPVAMAALHETYQNTLAGHTGSIGIILALIPFLFTLWLVIKTGEPHENRYGPVLTNRTN